MGVYKEIRNRDNKQFWFSYIYPSEFIYEFQSLLKLQALRLIVYS